MVIVQQPRPSSSVTMSSTTSQLFQPIQVGDVQLRHRIVLPGLTRLKSGEKNHVPNVKLMKEYYSQRGSQHGTLLISEATLIARKAGLSPHVPGFYAQEQLDAWKEVSIRQSSLSARAMFLTTRPADHRRRTRPRQFPLWTALGPRARSRHQVST